MQGVRETRFLLLGVFVCLIFSVSIFTVPAIASVYDFTTVASPILVTGTANDHDIVSYHSDADIYQVSGSFADESMFGVIVDDPVLYLESPLALYDNARPVVRHGEALVNVSTLGGEIHAGDIVTTSPILGIGQRAKRQDATYILGFALDTMVPSGRTIMHEGKEVELGTVPVALRIGPYLTQESIAFVATGKEILSKTGGLGGLTGEDGSRQEEIPTFKVFRYILATLIAVTSIVVSLGKFGDAFKQSVVSIGRNPLARSQIRAILFWNIVLMFFVSGAGLSVAAAIILMP